MCDIKKDCRQCAYCHAYAREVAVCDLHQKYFSFDRAIYCDDFELNIDGDIPEYLLRLNQNG